VPLLKSPFKFDETDLEFHGEQDDVLVWLTPNGDNVELLHFAVPPTLRLISRMQIVYGLSIGEVRIARVLVSLR